MASVQDSAREGDVFGITDRTSPEYRKIFLVVSLENGIANLHEFGTEIEVAVPLRGMPGNRTLCRLPVFDWEALYEIDGFIPPVWERVPVVSSPGAVRIRDNLRDVQDGLVETHLPLSVGSKEACGFFGNPDPERSPSEPRSRYPFARIGYRFMDEMLLDLELYGFNPRKLKPTGEMPQTISEEDVERLCSLAETAGLYVQILKKARREKGKFNTIESMGENRYRTVLALLQPRDIGKPWNGDESYAHVDVVCTAKRFFRSIPEAKDAAYGFLNGLLTY